MDAVSGLWQYHKQYFLLCPVNYFYLGWERKQCRDSVKLASWNPLGFCLKAVPSLLQHRTSSHRATPALDCKINVFNNLLFIVPLDECRLLLHTPTVLTLGQQQRGSNRRVRKGFSGNSPFSLGIPEAAHDKISRLTVAHGPGIKQKLQLCFANPWNLTKQILYTLAFSF